MARVSGNEKLFRLDIDTGQQDADHVRHARRLGGAVPRRRTRSSSPSTATDPSQPIDPDVARNGNIYNIWTLDLKNGELRQYTDALGGNTTPSSCDDGNEPPQIGFISYYKGDYELHALERREPIVTAASADFGAPGPVIDFQAPLSHTLRHRQDQEEGHVREDVPRRPPAGERRRDERRRRLRRHRR